MFAPQNFLHSTRKITTPKYVFHAFCTKFGVLTKFGAFSHIIFAPRISGVAFPLWCGCSVEQSSSVAGQPATTSGVAILGRFRCSRHVADITVGSIPGYAQHQPPPGVGEMSAFGHRRHRYLGSLARTWHDVLLPAVRKKMTA